jgi:hypothetical protein
MNWNDFLENIRIWFNEFIDWYLIQPHYGQVLVGIGIVALLALIITLVYYILKGIAYLVYYIMKGMYYILKGIGYGFYKLFECLYYLVSGKTRNSPQQDSKSLVENNIKDKSLVIFEFCNECGAKISEKMRKHLDTYGMVFCVNCGNQFTLKYPLESCPISE